MAHTHSDVKSLNYFSTGNEKIPTFLHFAAEYGFHKLCSALLDCIGATVACQIRNVHGRAPAEIALSAGHAQTAELLENFQVMIIQSRFDIALTDMSTDDVISRKFDHT